MGGQRLICADGERIDGWSALGDGVCGGAADYGDGEDGTGEGGGWGGKCFFFFFFLLLFSRVFFYIFSFLFGRGIYICIVVYFLWFGKFLWRILFYTLCGPSLHVFWERGFRKMIQSRVLLGLGICMNANQWMGEQIGFGPWRSNLRKSSAVEIILRGYIQFPKCTIVFVIVHCSSPNTGADNRYFPFEYQI